MKYSEFRRWLKRQGVIFQPGKGSHWKVTFNGTTTIFPDHGSKEMPEPLRKVIIRQLGEPQQQFRCLLPEGGTMYEYPVTILESEGVHLVFCPDIPEMHSVGDSLEEALREAEDSLVTALSIYVDQRRAIPQPSPQKNGQHVAHLPALVVAKVVLWNTLQEQKLRKADLARQLGVKPTQVDRLVDFLHSSKIEHVETALAALGKRIGVTVEAA